MAYRWRVAIVAVVLEFVCAPRVSEACSCALLDHAQAVRQFPVAFRGTVRSARRVGGDVEITFAVHVRWNGVSAATREVRVLRRRGRSMCPIPSFREGVRYNVYAERDHGALRVSGCNPSEETEFAAPSGGFRR